MHLCHTQLNEGLKNDENYLKSAMDQIQLLERYHFFTSSTRLLEFGCGQGRLAHGLITDGGVLNLTAFIEKEVPNVEENPVGFLNINLFGSPYIVCGMKKASF